MRHLTLAETVTIAEAVTGIPAKTRSIRTTYDVYGHLYAGRDRQAADRLEQLARQATRQRDPTNRLQRGLER